MHVQDWLGCSYSRTEWKKLFFFGSHIHDWDGRTRERKKNFLFHSPHLDVNNKAPKSSPDNFTITLHKNSIEWRSCVYVKACIPKFYAQVVLAMASRSNSIAVSDTSAKAESVNAPEDHSRSAALCAGNSTPTFLIHSVRGRIYSTCGKALSLRAAASLDATVLTSDGHTRACDAT